MRYYCIFLLIVAVLAQGACTKIQSVSRISAFSMQSCRPNGSSSGASARSLKNLLPAALSARLGAEPSSAAASQFRAGEVKFGTEIEFPVAPSAGQTSVQKLFSEMVWEKCKACYSCAMGGNNPYTPGFHIKRSNAESGITLNIQVDPGVIEVTTSPMTYKDMLSWQPVLDELVFETSRQLEAEGHLVNSDAERNRWSGHTNVSWGGFSLGKTVVDETKAAIALHSAGLLLNFYIDYANHPELALGVLGGDIRNAPPWVLGDHTNRQVLFEAKKKLAAKEINTPYEMAETLYGTSPTGFLGGYGQRRANFPPSDPAHKGHPRYSAINIQPLLTIDRDWGYQSSRRIEMRAFYSPRSSIEMIANATIVLARLSMLADKYETRPLESEVIKPSFVPTFSPPATIENHPTSGLLGGLTPTLGAKSFIKYLREAGLDPLLFADFIRDPQVKSEVKRQASCDLRYH